MLYESKTWCLRVDEIVILRMTERAMIRAMRGVILIWKRSSQELVNFLSLKETLSKLAKPIEV